jgi:hypothetical protein
MSLVPGDIAGSNAWSKDKMMRDVAVVLLSGAIVAFVAARCECVQAPSLQQLPDLCIEKLDSTADLTQTDPNAGLPNGGKSHCGPVAVSNSLLWLADNGFDNLAPILADRRKVQFEIARALGSKHYMNTNVKRGTGASGVLEGVGRYIEDNGYEYRYLKYQGWRNHPSRFGLGVAVPELDWLKSGVRGNSGVWLNVGWYKYDSSNDEYVRIGGHWVTLVGYGVDENGRCGPAILIIHDPAPRCGKDPHEYVQMKLMNSGRLTGKSSGLPRQAKGYYIMAGGMHVRKGADFGILDGAVVLKMHENTTKRQR